MLNVHNEAKYAIAASDYRCLACAQEVACEALYYSAVIFGDGAFQRRNYCVGCWKRDLTREPGGETRGETGIFASWRSRRPTAPSERPRKAKFDPQLAMEFFLRLGSESGASSDHDDEEGPRAEDGGAVGRGDLESAEVPEDVEPEATGEPGSPEAERIGSAAAGPRTDSERDQLRFLIALLLVRKKALRFKSSIDRGGQELLLLVDRETPPRVHEVLNPGLSEGQLERLKERLGELLQMQI